MINTIKYKRIPYKILQEILPKDIIFNLLWEENLTYKDISKMYNTNEHQISRLSKDYNINKNNYAIGQAKNKERIKIFDEKELIELYCNQKLSIRKIAEINNKNHNIISRKLKQLGIIIRPAHDKLYYINRQHYIGDYHISENGYLKYCDEYVHRLVMEEYLKRELDFDEYVHHIDFNKLNNDIDNLFLFPSNNLHMFYHGYIKDNNYISPDEYLIYYEENLKNTYDNYYWLYNKYIKNRLSCNEISNELNISRVAITNDY